MGAERCHETAPPDCREARIRQRGLGLPLTGWSVRPQLSEEAPHLRERGARQVQHHRRAAFAFSWVSRERRTDGLRHERRAEQLLRHGIVELARDAMAFLKNSASACRLIQPRILDGDRQLVCDDAQRLGIILVERCAALDVDYAEDIGAEQVTVSVSPLSREANRFYAQLGLTPLSVRRVAPAAALRRRLATIDTASSPHDVVRRRPIGTRTGMRAALRRIAIASTVADQPRDA